jgi:hypothetical protein
MGHSSLSLARQVQFKRAREYMNKFISEVKNFHGDLNRSHHTKYTL